MADSKKIFGAGYLFTGLLILFSTIATGWYFNRAIVIREITVHGYDFTDPDEIISQSGLNEGIHGDSIIYLDVIEKVEKLPWIESAHISLAQSGELRIRVEEEKPMALLVDGERSSWVTKPGIQLPIVLGKPVDVPILHGFQVTDKPDTLQSDQFLKARSFLTTAYQYPGLYAMISELMVTKEEGVIALSDHNAVRLTFGHENFDERLRKWQIFQSKVISEKGMYKMRSLDFRFRNQVVAIENNESRTL